VLLIAGVRFLTSAVPSRLVHVSVSGAGLMDPAAIIYSPAIRVDYNVHTLERLSVAGNLAGGVVIMRNDVYAGARLASSLVRDNRGTGVAVRGSFFELYDCRLTGNRVAGLEYNPSYTADEALQVRHVPPPSSVLLFRRPRSEDWPHRGRTFYIYLFHGESCPRLIL